MTHNATLCEVFMGELSKNPAAVALGRLGGKSRSPAKLKAIAKNAKLGGWPKGRPRKVASVIASVQNSQAKADFISASEGQ